MEVTYILRRPDVSYRRSFYIGRTNNLERRLKEHLKDRYKAYRLIWYIEGNYEKKFKKFGATKLVELIKMDLIKGGEKINRCIDCGKEICSTSARCGSCATKYRYNTKSFGVKSQFKKGESLWPEFQFKPKYEDLQFPETNKEKNLIRVSDRYWFVQHLYRFKQHFEIHHDFKNGSYCYLLTIKEHKEIHRNKGEKRQNDK